MRQHPAAQSTVAPAMKLPAQRRPGSPGDMTLNGELPFFTMPDDPFVDVFVEQVCDVRFISDSSGGLHILVKEVKETRSATVVGTNFDYEFVSHEGFSPNNISAKGHFAGTIHEKIVLVRLDPSPSPPSSPPGLASPRPAATPRHHDSIANASSTKIVRNFRRTFSQ